VCSIELVNVFNEKTGNIKKLIQATRKITKSQIGGIIFNITKRENIIFYIDPRIW